MTEKWEYRVVVQPERTPLGEWLNQFGLQGWELMHVPRTRGLTPAELGSTLGLGKKTELDSSYLFKRRLND
jgi:hypothetical protein